MTMIAEQPIQVTDTVTHQPVSGSRVTSNEMHFARLFGRDEVPPDLFINVIGHCRSRGSFRYRLDESCHYMRFMIAGDGHGDYDGRRVRIRADDVVLYCPGKPFVLRDEPDAPWEFIWLALGGRSVPWALKRVGLPLETRSFQLGAGNPVVPLARAIFEQFRHGRRHDAYPICAGWQLLVATVEALHLVPEPNARLDVEEASRRYIEDGDGPVGIAGLASHLGMSRSSLFRLFQRQYGIAPKEFLDRVLLEKACHLLSSTGMQVAEVARRCRYNDPEYFAKRFRARYRSSPMAWRRNQRQHFNEAAVGLG
jgi:AraC-like DNA-binding protein